MSTTPDSALADPQQIIADLQRELAERTEERDEALQREIAAAEVLQVINSSPGDLSSVFDAILEKARVLCGFAHGDFNIYDGEYFRTVASYAMPEAFAELLRQPRRPSGAAERLLHGEEVVHIADMTAMEFSISPDDAIRRAAVEAGLRTVLFVPLRKDGALLGYITANRQEVRPFSDKQIALLQNFAAQAVIAMENARLITETREALEQQTATAEVLQVINASPGDLAPVFDAILEKAMRLCEAAFGNLKVYDGNDFRPGAMRGLPPRYAAYLATTSDEHAGSQRALRGENVIQEIDLMEAERYRAGHPSRRALVDLGGARSNVVVALRKDSAFLGTITIYRQEVRPFTDKQIALLQNFAAQAVIAIENARLITETREALEQQTATAEVLQVINSSPGDLAPVFDAILEKAHNLCGADHGNLTILEGEQFRVVSTHNMSEQLDELFRQPFRAYTSGPQERMLSGEPFIHILDQAEREPTNQLTRAVTDAGVRTIVFVPLRRDDALLGYITAHRREVRPFTDKQIALLQNFAAQAVIAMENARLINETREALEQQTATAEVLGVINASPGDLAPVFDAMLEKAMRLCEADFGGLWTYDGGNFRSAAMSGVPEPFAEFCANNLVFGPGSGPARLVEGEPFNHVVDLTASEAYLTGEPNRKALVDLGGARTALAVPLRKDDALVGLIMIYRQEVRPFSDKQIALLQNFAAQAVIAMENARLITETREALEQQTATAEVLGVINSSPGDLAPVFDAMLEKAHALCGAEIGSLTIYDGETNRAVATRGLAPALADRLRQGFRPGPEHPIRKLLSGARVVQVSDVGESADPIARASIEEGGIRTSLYVPLRKDDRLLGLIVASRQEVRPFSDKQIALLQNFAAQAVIAMDNARLITETREALEQQTATAEVLQVINSSPGDLAPVFDAMVEKAMRLCGAAHGALRTFDGEALHLVAMHGAADLVARVRQTGPIRPQPGSPYEPLVRGEQIVHVVDARDSIAYQEFATSRERVDALCIRTFLAVALSKDGTLLGALSIFRQEVRPFTDQEITLLKNFAAQAVIAMENARLLGELRQRTDDLAVSLEYQTAISDVLKVISRSTFDLQPVLDTLCETAARLCDANSARIALQRDGSYRYVSSFVGRAISPEFDAMVREMRLRADRGTVTGRALLERQTVHVADISASAEEYAVPETFTVGGIRTLLAVPLLREDELIGLITLSRTEVDPFTERQIELVRTFADQAVIAIENARLLGELRQRTEEVGELNRDLEARVAEQVDELGRVGRLKRFLAPQLAELIVSHGDEKILESHRREIVVVFCDLRGYTAFTETAEPEEVLDFLREYHGALGPLVSQFEGTLDQFSGDGIMVFFNDPVPCPDPAERAVKMAIAMREAAGTLIAHWRERGRDLGFGAGIAQGYATLGQIGFSERSGYTAIGTVCNVAARLCAEAKDGQILLGQLVNVALKGSVATEQLGPLALKGLSQPVVAYNVPLAPGQPALRVIEGGPQSV